jgi:phenylacetate-CoA ligase
MPTSAASDPRSSVETLHRPEIEALQLDRLHETLARVLAAQPAGAERLASGGIDDPEALTSLRDLADVPFMTKDDLRRGYPFGLLAVPRDQIVRIHASSGTHGKPTVVAYTRTDLENWTELMARCMSMTGVRAGMVIHNANGYGLFTGGLGFHQGGERLGATVVPASGGFTARQATLIRDLGANVLVSTPSYALAIAQALDDASDGSDASDGGEAARGSLARGLFGGEPWTEAMRHQIERALGLTAFNFYGLSEMCGPGVAAECPERQGLHVQEDHFLVETIDPINGAVLEPGSEGELVFTTLTKEALPLIRYRTRDIGSVIVEPCGCGRTTARLVGLRGRHDDMLIVRGVNVHPSNVEHLLLSVEGTSPHYRLILERRGLMDELSLEFEPAPGHDPAPLAQTVQRVLRENTGLRIPVSAVELGSIPRSVGKAARVEDRREGHGA